MHTTIPKGILGDFEFTVLQRKLKEQHESRGVARIFQRGGHRGYSPDCHVDLHAVHVVLSRHEGPY